MIILAIAFFTSR